MVRQAGSGRGRRKRLKRSPAGPVVRGPRGARAAGHRGPRRDDPAGAGRPARSASHSPVAAAQRRPPEGLAPPMPRRWPARAALPAQPGVLQSDAVQMAGLAVRIGGYAPEPMFQPSPRQRPAGDRRRTGVCHGDDRLILPAADHDGLCPCGRPDARPPAAGAGGCGRLQDRPACRRGGPATPCGTARCAVELPARQLRRPAAGKSAVGARRRAGADREAEGRRLARQGPVSRPMRE
jgi:hypothetical protein